MLETLALMESFSDYSHLGRRIALLTGLIYLLALGAVAFLLFAGDRVRARGYEFTSRRKLGHEQWDKNDKPGSRWWAKLRGQCRSDKKQEK